MFKDFIDLSVLKDAQPGFFLRVYFLRKGGALHWLDWDLSCVSYLFQFVAVWCVMTDVSLVTCQIQVDVLFVKTATLIPILVGPAYFIVYDSNIQK